jgi:hypothetical protein
VTEEPALFHNDVETTLAALAIYVEDIRSDPCFVGTQAAASDLDLCNEVHVPSLQQGQPWC